MLLELAPVDLYCLMAHETSEIQMSRKNPLEKLCPECEEDMNPVYDKNRVLVCWECTECGKLVSAAKEIKQEQP